jgi:prepilin-type N-terminal cleavage/methylation domain-containing protein
MFNRKTKAGFTLIELLVVIAIIGILSSVVLASLNSARRKSRDARRIADLKQIQVALELFYDSRASYPSSTSLLVGAGFIPQVPNDPSTQAAYPYAGIGAAATCTSYHLGATLEDTAHSALNGDIDAAAVTPVCTGSAADFAGTDPIYDLKP